MAAKFTGDKLKVVIYTYFLISLLLLTFGTLEPYADCSKTSSENCTDFITFLAGASIARDGRIKEIYNQDLQTKYQYFFTAPNQMERLLSFRLLPFVAYLYIPLLYLEPAVAFYTQAAVNIILLFLSVWIIKKSYQLNLGAFWLCTSTILGFIPFRTAVLGGQISTLILLVLCISIYLTKHSKYFLAGALLGLLFLKVNMLAVVPFLFVVEYLRNRLSFKGLASGFLTSSFVIVGLNVLIYGPDLLTIYPHNLILGESLRYGIPLISNNNPISLMSLITNNRYILFSGTVIISLGIAFIFLLLFRKIKNFDLLYATVPALGLFLNFHTMASDLTLLVLSIYLIGNYYFNLSKKQMVGLLKCFGVIFIFSLCTWLEIYHIYIVGWLTLLLFFYITLRVSVGLIEKTA